MPHKALYTKLLELELIGLSSWLRSSRIPDLIVFLEKVSQWSRLASHSRDPILVAGSSFPQYFRTVAELQPASMAACEVVR